MKAKKGLIINSQIDMDVKIQVLTNSQFPYLIKQFTCTQTGCSICFVFIDMGNGVEVRFDKTVAMELIIN